MMARLNGLAIKKKTIRFPVAHGFTHKKNKKTPTLLKVRLHLCSGEPKRPDDTVSLYWTTQRVRRNGSDGDIEIRTTCTCRSLSVARHPTSWNSTSDAASEAQIRILKLRGGHFLLGVDPSVSRALCLFRFVRLQFVSAFNQSIDRPFLQ